MPEINTTFTQGRMNLDLEEKILPNGEYRGALNIQVSTSDEDSVGSVQPIMGNEKLTTGLSQNWGSFECIGSIADEKNDVAYWFLVKDDNTQSAILRCFKNNSGNLETGIVLTDNQNKILEFTVENYITGINIVDDFLYFTDGITEPKVINITQFLNNITASLSSTSDLYINGENKGTVTKNDITVIKPRPLNPISIELVPGDERNIVYNSTFNLNFSGKGTGDSIVISVSLQEFLAVGAYTIFDPQNVGIARDYFGLNVNPLTGKFQAKYGGGNTFPASVQNTNYEYYDAISPGFEPGDVLLLSPQSTPGTLPTNTQARIKITSMALKPDPYTTQVFQFPPHGYINRNTPFYAQLNCEIIDVSSNIANKSYKFNVMKEDASKLIFEKVFPRFSYRYKYSDNQYSAFAPFTQPAFLPGRFNIHPTKEPTNTGMENNINKIILRDFVHQSIPRDVVEIDLLYKEDGSPTVYLIDTIKSKKSDQSDVEAWHTFDGNNETFTFIDGSGSNTNNTNSGYYELTKEIIYSALPENQTLRIYDNVPKKAKAQDFTAGRIIYANYTQNLDVRDYENNLRLNLEDRNFGFIEKLFDAGALKTVKSQRTYQVGISLLDYQGRETPVFTSGEKGSITVPFNQSTDPYALIAFEGNASKSNRLKVSDIPNAPSYINKDSIFNLGDSSNYDPYYFKLYVKETSSEYYNLVLDRVYRSKEDGNLWLSFPSADRNKIKEDDFIILKKPLESDTQVQVQNKFKVIAIRNESPNFIRDKFRNLGAVDGDGDLDALYPDPGLRPAAGQRKIVINKTLVVNERVNALQQMFNRSEELAIKFKKDPVGGTTLNSEIYNITSLELTGDEYIITFDKPIRETDGWVEQSVGVVDPDLKTLFFKVENKQWQEFQGRFFVKILSNIVTAQYLEPMIGAGEIFNIITARAKFFSLRDGNLFTSLDTESRYSSSHDYGQDTSSNTNLASNNTLNRTQNFEEFESLFNFDGTSGTSQGTDGSDWFIDELHYASQQPLTVPDVTTSKYDNFVADAQGSSAAEITSRQDFDASISGNLRGMNFSPLYGSSSFTSGSTFTFSNTQQIVVGSTGAIFRHGPLTVDVGTAPDSNDTFKRSAMGSPMNGMQGIVKTVTGHLSPNQTSSAPWPLAWKKQLDHINTSAIDNYRDVYGDSTGRHFIHLSFSGVGVDLVDEDSFVLFDETGDGINYNSGLTQYIGNGFWREGVEEDPDNFIPQEPEQVPGGTMDLQGIVNGNRQKTIFHNGIGKILPFPQRPNSTLNDPNLGAIIENQWNPAGNEAIGNFSAGNEAFINKLQPGNFFRFTNDLNLTQFEILGVQKVRVYNHTPWNRCVILDDQNAASGEWVENTNSVGYAYDRWISKAYQTDNSSNRQLLNQYFAELEDAIIRFGRANNRRICYVIEVDKNATSVCSTNPESLNFDNDPSDDFGFIEFFEQDFSDGENAIKENPAIFETEPKEKLDLDLYYEASPIYPLRLDINSNQLDAGDANPNNSKGYLSAKVGTKVKVTGAGMSIANTYTASGNPHQGRQIDCRVKSWDGNIVELAGGISALGNTEGFNYVDPNNPNTTISGQRSNITHQRQFFKDKFLEFYDDEENSYIKYKIDRVIDIGITTPTTAATDYESIKKIRLHPKPEEVGLPYFNAFSFGNGVESNRIRDDFNQTFIKNGARVSTTLDEKYKQDIRTNGLIFSGIYNKSTSLNDLNQFIQAENITKELDNTYGSIQKLFARNSDLIALCEDKIVQIFADKDLIFNADGNTQLTASNKVLGQSRPFVGEYGISKNPESFASSSYRAYFTDKQRGAVLRLSMDGLTPISDAGMRDWFRDKLKSDYYRIVGSYDKTKNDYNLTFDSGNGFAYVEDNFNTSRNVYKNAGQSITVTYKENVKGWSSFKAFIQESGVVINNEYITFRDGKAFHHNENVGACHFYNNSNPLTRIASVNAIFNDAPLSIKNFNTLNYVGDFKGDNSRVPAWTCNRLETERGEGRILSTPFNTNSIIDNPNVDQFVKKEEKSFAYIQHMHGETDGTIDTESGSNLGVGEAFEHEQL